jgi:hypothetical protein
VTGQRIKIHFAQSIVARIGTQDLLEWGDVLRAWHHDGDPDRIFGRDSPNSRDGTPTWAHHLHMVPSTNDAAEAVWLGKSRAFDRTSDRFIIYSLDAAAPLKYGMYLLDLLGDPGAHAKAFTGAQAQERREIWEDIAWNHQMGVYTPAHTV